MQHCTLYMLVKIKRTMMTTLLLIQADNKSRESLEKVSFYSEIYVCTSLMKKLTINISNNPILH